MTLRPTRLLRKVCVMPDGTPLRNVRVPDDLWQAAMSKALERGETLSEVIRKALEKYVQR